LKQMPGSVYFDILKYNLTKIGLEIDDVKSDNAHYSQTKNLIALSKEKQDIFTLMHELGHFRDFYTNLNKNKELKNIYEAEKLMLRKNASNQEITSLDYFISNDVNCVMTNRSLKEMIAETHALMYADNKSPEIEMRSQYLQQYFPKTCAKIIELFKAEN